MKTFQIIAVLSLIAGVSCAAAAQSETRHVDRRVMVTANSATQAPGEPREPVTFLGVAVAPAEPVLSAQLRLPEGQGLVVNVVEPDSPAAKAGIQQHDVLTKLDDQILIDPRQLSVLVRSRKEGATVTLTYVRAGSEAKATATLATHVPGPELFFKWIGEGQGDVMFHTENFGPGIDAELLPPGGPHVGPFNGPAGPSAGVRGNPAGTGVPGDRVMFFPPRANLVFSDDAGMLVLQVGDRGQELTAKNPAGEVVFNGPVGTPEQRAALPPELRARLEKLERLDVFETAVPPPGTPGAPGFTPAMPARPAAPVL